MEQLQELLGMEIDPEDEPAWTDGKTINETLFAEQFLKKYQLVYCERAFFSPDGRVSDPDLLRSLIFAEISPYIVTNISRKVTNIVDVLKMSVFKESLPLETDRIHLANGTLFLNGDFHEGKNVIVRSRLPVTFNANAPKPVRWLCFLQELFYEEDIPTVQEYLGYCLLPLTKAQRMLIIKGKGGEGKTQFGTVVKAMFGGNAKDGSIVKLSENRFAPADLEHILLMVDDDMKMDKLRDTSYVKRIVTSQGLMDLERKNKQSYQGYMYARLIAFSNGNLEALYDKSDGFYRRQLMLTTKGRAPGRIDDPHISEKMCRELEGILLWALQGLHRLIAQNYHFTESPRAIANREYVKRDSNNVLQFLASEGYFRFESSSALSASELYEIYLFWCDENAQPSLRKRSFSNYLVENQESFGLTYDNNIKNASGRRVWGFHGIRALIDPRIENNRYYRSRTYVPNVPRDTEN